jgi:hypothetical protein
LVEGYNQDFANESAQQSSFMPEDPATSRLANLLNGNGANIAALEESTAPAARQHTVFLVDMAGAEALESMGENQKALDLIDRHV